MLLGAVNMEDQEILARYEQLFKVVYGIVMNRKHLE
jgi:hypothetical protein